MMFLIIVKAVATEEEYSNTRRIAEEFANGIGKELHEKLVQRSKEHRNWVMLLSMSPCRFNCVVLILITCNIYKISQKSGNGWLTQEIHIRSINGKMCEIYISKKYSKVLEVILSSWPCGGQKNPILKSWMRIPIFYFRFGFHGEKCITFVFSIFFFFHFIINDKFVCWAENRIFYSSFDFKILKIKN